MMLQSKGTDGTVLVRDRAGKHHQQSIGLEITRDCNALIIVAHFKRIESGRHCYREVQRGFTTVGNGIAQVLQSLGAENYIFRSQAEKLAAALASSRAPSGPVDATQLAWQK